MKHFLWGLVGVLGATATVFAWEGRALAAGPANCSGFTGPKIVIESGDTQEPLLKALGQQLASSATPLRVLYVLKGTCTLADDLYKGLKIPINTNIKYVPTPVEDPAWDPSKDAPTCVADADTTVDLGIGATFLSSCTALGAKPATLSVVNGPIQGYGFIVPAASQEKVLTAEEGYFAFGFGATGEAKPWTDPAFLFIRSATKSTALTLSASVGVPVGKLKGTVPTGDSSSAVLAAVTGSANPDKTMGMLGVEIYDANRGKGVKLLAFRGFKQRYAYYPDSTVTSFDKRNLRDGHYLPWSPTVYITTVDASNVPTNADVKRFRDQVFGAAPAGDVNGLDVVISKGLVPDCAMQVKREFDGANLSVYQPAVSCSCYYESKVPQGSTKCATCTTEGSACSGGGTCHRGLCEVR